MGRRLGWGGFWENNKTANHNKSFELYQIHSRSLSIAYVYIMMDDAIKSYRFHKNYGVCLPCLQNSIVVVIVVRLRRRHHRRHHRHHHHSVITIN